MTRGKNTCKERKCFHELSHVNIYINYRARWQCFLLIVSPIYDKQIYHRYDFRVKSSVEPDPVAGWDNAVSGHRAEHDRAQFLPLLCEVERMNLSCKHSQYESQHRQQVHLPPKLKQTSRVVIAIVDIKQSISTQIYICT